MKKVEDHPRCCGSSTNLDETVTDLRAQLEERDAEVARLEVLLQERTQLVETRATELADLHVCMSRLLSIL